MSEKVTPEYYIAEFRDAPHPTAFQIAQLTDLQFEGAIILKREELFNGILIDPYEDRN
jgi:hypothetical protein